MIREVRLLRFKRFDDVTFRIPDHIVLAGPNNTGKTTLLQSIAAFEVALRKWRELNDFNQRNGYPYQHLERLAFSAVALPSFELLWRERRRGDPIVIEVVADGHHRIGMEFHFNSPGQVNVRPTPASRADDLRNFQLKTTFVPAMSGLLREERRLADEEAIDDLLAQNRPGEVLRNLLVLAHRQPAAWAALTSAMRRMFNVELQAPVTGAVLSCDYQPSGSTVKLDISSAGSGFQQVLMLLTLLNTRQSNVVLLDEPDAHLHLFLQDSIFSELRSAAARNHSQLIIATHSEVVIDSADPREVCLMYGKPKLLADDQEKATVIRGLKGLSNADLMLADAAAGVIYLEDYTDLELLREFAKVLNHQPAIRLLTQRLMWKPTKAPLPDGLGEFNPQQHWNMLKLVNAELRALELIDGDSKNKADDKITGLADCVQRLRWKRYEIESYLLHPALMERFVELVVGSKQAGELVRAEMTSVFQADYMTNPDKPNALVANYLRTEPSSKTTIPALLQAAGIHGFEKNRMHEIAALARPEELDAEIREKLDQICRAFGVDPAAV